MNDSTHNFYYPKQIHVHRHSGHQWKNDWEGKRDGEGERVKEEERKRRARGTKKGKRKGERGEEGRNGPNAFNFIQIRIQAIKCLNLHYVETKRDSLSFSSLCPFSWPLALALSRLY